MSTVISTALFLFPLRTQTSEAPTSLLLLKIYHLRWLQSPELTIGDGSGARHNCGVPGAVHVQGAALQIRGRIRLRLRLLPEWNLVSSCPPPAGLFLLRCFTSQEEEEGRGAIASGEVVVPRRSGIGSDVWSELLNFFT